MATAKNSAQLDLLTGLPTASRPRFAHGQGRDPEKRRAKGKRHYERHREQAKRRVAERRDARRADPTAAEKDRIWRREHKRQLRAANLAAGLSSNGTPRKLPPRDRLSEVARFEAAQNRLAELNAKQAWKWWLKCRAPRRWLQVFRSSRRLHRYRTDPQFQLYTRLKRWMQKHLREKGGESKEVDAVSRIHHRGLAQTFGIAVLAGHVLG